jgi:hypothetical protein
MDDQAIGGITGPIDAPSATSAAREITSKSEKYACTAPNRL